MALSNDQMKYKFVATAMDGSIPPGAGELYNVSAPSYTDALNGMRSAGCTIPVDSPRADWLLNNDALIKFYRADRTGVWQLLLNGDVVSTEEAGDGNTESLTVTVADPFFRLNARLQGMGVNASHQGTGFTAGTPSVQIDLSQMIVQLLAGVNSDFNSGVKLGTVTNSGTMGALGPLYAVYAGPTIQEVNATLGGPDFWIVPQEAQFSMPSTIIGQMNIAPWRGTNRPNAIFEYGCGKHNVANYNRILSKQNVCNHAVSLPQGWPTGVNASDSVATYDDTASQNAIGRFDSVVSTDVANLQLRQILCQENVNVRKQKQQQITFVPTVDNPMDYTVDYNVGDVVTARAYNTTLNKFRFNGSIRIYGVSLSLDENGAETVQLTLIPDSVAGGVS